jgi:hypothetical protein
VCDFVSRNTGQHDANQGQVSRSVGGAVAVVFRPENEHRQDQESQVKANLDSEQASNVNGETSHEVWLLQVFYMVRYIGSGSGK